jgi:HlyD family secretion protein
VGLVAWVAGCGGRSGPDGSGSIECTQVQVAALVAGRLVEVAAREGDAVQAGAPVARLDVADHEPRRAEAAAGVAAAQAQVDLLVAGAREEDVARAAAQVREAEAAARLAEADLRRVTDLFTNGTTTARQMDEARAQAERTGAAVAAAQQQHARLAKGSRPEEIALARAQWEQARARLAAAEKAVADCVIRAPANGVVTTRVREPGEVVGVGSPLLTLSRLDEVWLSVYVPEPSLAGVKLGQPGWVRVDGDARFHEGRVTYVSPVAEFTPRNVQTPDERTKLVYRVKIALANPEGGFKSGMPADGFLKAPRP